jgi:hypothetical protein
MSWLGSVGTFLGSPITGGPVAPLEPESAETVTVERATPPAHAGRAASTVTTPRGMVGGRITQDSNDRPLFGGVMAIIPPTDAEDNWRMDRLDSHSLDRLSPARLLELLAELSPDVSKGLWDFLRFMNPGWEARALRAGSDEPDEAATVALNGILATIKTLYKSVDVVIARLHVSAYLRGALLAEIVLDKSARSVVDVATPDPSTVRFRRRDDPVRGSVAQLCQWQGTKLVDLDAPTIGYIPIDPFPGSPYGRALAAPALFPALFLLGLLHDLRRVVSQQGYPRLDLEIVMEKLVESMPPDLENDDEAKKEWITAATEEIASVYSRLQPDDAYVHMDLVKVNRPVGAIDSSSLGAVDGLIRGLERLSVRALKSTSFLMGSQESTTETQANRQYEAYVQGIRAIQHLSESLLEELLTVGLQAQGIAATVEFRFAENRASEAMRDALTEQLQIANAAEKRDQGWITQDDAAQAIVGHDAVGESVAAVPSPAPVADPNVDPGANRSHQRQQRAKLVPKGAGEPFDPIPESATYTDAEIRGLLDTWDSTLPDYAGLLDAAVEA